jgi:hypothetical protein
MLLLLLICSVPTLYTTTHPFLPIQNPKDSDGLEDILDEHIAHGRHAVLVRVVLFLVVSIEGRERLSTHTYICFCI